MKIMMLVNKDDDIELKKIHLHSDEEEDCMYDEMFDEVEEILDNPPKTWKKYHGTDDECDSIINMEIQELMDAKRTKKFHETEHEYLHCAAAFLYGCMKAKELRMKHEEK